MLRLGAGRSWCLLTGCMTPVLFAPEHPSLIQGSGQWAPYLRCTAGILNWFWKQHYLSGVLDNFLRFRPEQLSSKQLGTVNRVRVLSCFSLVRLFATQWTVAHQVPPSMGFSRWEYWGGLPFPFPKIVCVLSHFSHAGLFKTSELMNRKDESEDYWKSGLHISSNQVSNETLRV